MLSKYFEIKTKEQKFEDDLLCLIKKLKGKKIIIYGAEQSFKELNKKYKFSENLNIVAITDKIFEKKTCDVFYNIKAIRPKNISKEKYDYILIADEHTVSIKKYLEHDLDIDDKKIKPVFNEEIKDECDNLNYLYNYKFDKTLPKLIKKLKNKTVIIYGAGVFIELIQKYFDLSGLNIIGIADRRFECHKKNETFLGYKACAPNEITELNPDYVLVATKLYINIIESLYYNTLKDTKIKIKPLLRKPLLTLMKEIWE